MNYTWMEELFDTLLLIGAFVISLVFFGWYWGDSFQTRYAERVVEEFLEDAVNHGEFTVEQYESFLAEIRKIDAEYRVELVHTQTNRVPVYSQISQRELNEYFSGRNIRKEILLKEESPETKESIESGRKLQEETNASILAAAKQPLPLPGEEENISVCAVRSYQEVYEGEELITLCLVTSEEGSYYAEAEPVYAKETGKVPLKLVIQGEENIVFVDVVCVPRMCTCKFGHCFANTKQRIEQQKFWSIDTICPFCKIIPETLKYEKSVIYAEVGDTLEDCGLVLSVKYLDGHEAVITPKEDGWRDNYDTNYCGMQNVTVSYRGLCVTVPVVSEGGICQNCGGRCSGRSYSDYKEFPYCSVCMSQKSFYTGKIFYESNKVTEPEIVNRLDLDGKYVMEWGDMLMIMLEKRQKFVSVSEKTVRKRVVQEKQS